MKARQIIAFLLLVIAVQTTNAITICHRDTSRERPKKINKSLTTQVPENVVDKDCGKIELVVAAIDEAIQIGAPTYNDGNHAACFKIYEGTAYKILYKYGAKCKQTAEILETALDKITGNYSVTEKAWIMRMAFDKILGVPTQTK